MDKQAIVLGFVDTWLPRLFLSGWNIDIKIKGGLCPDDKTIEAEIDVDLKYRRAELSIFSIFWKRDTLEQEQIIVHELVHIPLWRLDPYLGEASKDSVEEVIQTLAMAFYNAYRDG